MLTEQIRPKSQIHFNVNQLLLVFKALVIDLISSNICFAYRILLLLAKQTKQDAKQLVRRAYELDPDVSSADQLVQTSFQLKGTP